MHSNSKNNQHTIDEFQLQFEFVIFLSMWFEHIPYSIATSCVWQVIVICVFNDTRLYSKENESVEIFQVRTLFLKNVTLSCF